MSSNKERKNHTNNIYNETVRWIIFVKKYAKENSRTEDACVTETDDRKSFFVSEMPGFVNY